MFHLGPLEVLGLLVCAGLVVAAYSLRNRWAKSMLLATLCLAVAAVITPADPLSSVLVAALLFGVAQLTLFVRQRRASVA